MKMPSINDPIHYRNYVLNMLVITAGSWQATGCKNEALEQKFEFLLNQLNPNRKTALYILQNHLHQEVTA